MGVAVTAGLILLTVFILLLVLKVPISISIAIASAVAILTQLPLDAAISVAAQQLAIGVDNFSLLAVPFFVLAGIIMTNGGLAERLVNLAKVLIGKMPGSLANTNILGNMLFGSIAGSSVASAVAIGGVMGPMQEKEGYDRRYSAAANISSAPMGLLLPPSQSLIIYSLASGGTSIAALFIAGYIPGILWGLLCIIVATIIAKRKKYPVSEGVNFSIFLKTFWEAIPSLGLIVVVIGGILAGFFTATEAAAVAVIYALILSFIYKNIKVKDIPGILNQSVILTCMILLLVAASGVMSWVMSYTGIPQLIGNILLGISDNIIVILLLINIILLLIGTFMDITPAILIFTPIFLPIVSSFGMDPIHFGIMMVMNLCIGNITPPVGSALFAGASVAKLEIDEVVKPLLPFYGAIVIALLFVTFVPALSLFLPSLLGL